MQMKLMWLLLDVYKRQVYNKFAAPAVYYQSVYYDHGSVFFLPFLMAEENKRYRQYPGQSVSVYSAGGHLGIF